MAVHNLSAYLKNGGVVFAESKIKTSSPLNLVLGLFHNATTLGKNRYA